VTNYRHGAPSFLSSEHLTNLRRLRLRAPGLDAFDALWGRPHLLARLESLELDEFCFRREDMAELLAHPWPRLRRLHLCESTMFPEAVVMLLESDLWPRLDDVALDNPILEPPHRAVLVAAVERMNAESLALPSFDDFDLFAALADARTWGRLRSLTIDAVGVPLDSLGRLLAHPGAANLAGLELDALRGAWAAGAVPLPANLRSLRCPFQDAFSALARARHPPPLVEVWAAGPEDDLVGFLGSPAASRLRRLELGGPVTDRVADAIASSPHLGRLATLTSYPGPVSVSAARLLAAGAANLPCLTYVRLQVAEAGVERVLLESPLRGFVGVADLGQDVAALRQARYRGINWAYVLDEL
jgi:hypothetical protein